MKGSKLRRIRVFDRITIICIIVIMSETMTSTEVARRFGEILAAVKHGGESVVVTKNGEPLAELRPVRGEITCTLREFGERWGERAAEGDRSFAADLAAVNASDQPATNPWDS